MAPQPLWVPFARHSLRRAAGLWGLEDGLQLLEHDGFPTRRVQLPPHYALALTAWRQAAPTVKQEAQPTCLLEAGDVCPFFHPEVRDARGALASSRWASLARAGVVSVGRLWQAVQASGPLHRLASSLWEILPERWRAEGCARESGSLPTRLESLGWAEATAWRCAVSAPTRLLRTRCWLLAHERASWVAFVPARCWGGGVLGPGSFNWERAFRRVEPCRRPGIDRRHAEAVWKALHGAWMQARPVGAWGRPVCPACGAAADTAHALVCGRHQSAIGWLWEVAESLAGGPVERSWGGLLGGRAPHQGLEGKSGRGYLWDVVRAAFLSALYRVWVRAWYAAFEGDALSYEAGHVVLATVGAVRAVARTDGRRALEGCSHARRDGVVVWTAPRRHVRAFQTSWEACGWAQASPFAGVLVTFGALFPVVYDLRGLSRLRPIGVGRRGLRLEPG